MTIGKNAEQLNNNNAARSGFVTARMQASSNFA